ncbi:hypothetical protein [Methylobacterium soli]|uniref:Uncharacterized protein n=1 Tax=Methylobacterium soli TaxID=553447 RepID=A0A6L3SX52_9HYPH|nr:hypothetical protein [Methylobacterium soli]KAB1077175.1 hypothetical protein F6X53_20050 [Methylobacterium soli]
MSPMFWPDRATNTQPAEACRQQATCTLRRVEWAAGVKEQLGLVRMDDIDAAAADLTRAAVDSET